MITTFLNLQMISEWFHYYAKIVMDDQSSHVVYVKCSEDARRER